MSGPLASGKGGIELVAQTVADQVHAHDEQCEEHAGNTVIHQARVM